MSANPVPAVHFAGFLGREVEAPLKVGRLGALAPKSFRFLGREVEAPLKGVGRVELDAAVDRFLGREVEAPLKGFSNSRQMPRRSRFPRPRGRGSIEGLAKRVARGSPALVSSAARSRLH